MPTVVVVVLVGVGEVVEGGGTLVVTGVVEVTGTLVVGVTVPPVNASFTEMSYLSLANPKLVC